MAGLPLAEADYSALALDLAVREVPDAAAILTGQLARIDNPDRRARFQFIMPALSADPAVRERWFLALKDVANRRREPWVLDGLRVPASSAARRRVGEVRAPEPGPAVGDPEDRRHLLPEALDGRDARRLPGAVGGHHGAATS